MNERMEKCIRCDEILYYDCVFDGSGPETAICAKCNLNYNTIDNSITDIMYIDYTLYRITYYYIENKFKLYNWDAWYNNSAMPLFESEGDSLIKLPSKELEEKLRKLSILI